MDSFYQINIMLVFGVKYRLGLIPSHSRQHIYATIAKIIKDHGQGSVPICIGGTADHVHILVSLSANMSIKDFVREVKSRSSRWINEQRLTLGNFAWQRGYGAFSYSKSSLDNVCRYISNQEEHHKRLSFRDEFAMLLNRFNIPVNTINLPKEPE